MQPAGKAHTMLQNAIPFFTHLFRKVAGLTFSPCCWGPVGGWGLLKRLNPSAFERTLIYRNVTVLTW